MFPGGSYGTLEDSGKIIEVLLETHANVGGYFEKWGIFRGCCSSPGNFGAPMAVLPALFCLCRAIAWPYAEPLIAPESALSSSRAVRSSPSAVRTLRPLCDPPRPAGSGTAPAAMSATAHPGGGSAVTWRVLNRYPSLRRGRQQSRRSRSRSAGEVGGSGRRCAGLVRLSACRCV